MKRVLLAAVAGLLAASVVAPAMADHENSPGKSQFGKCTAITNMNENGYNNGNAFRPFDHIEDDDDSTDDFAEAVAYCADYIANNHPGNPGGGGNGGGGNGGGGNERGNPNG